VDRAQDRALAIRNHTRDLLERIAQANLSKEVIEGDELKGLLAESVMPDEARALA
jgi:cell division protease FtsH